MTIVAGVTGVSFDEQAVGKTLSDTKTRTCWLLTIDGRSQTVELTNSRLSGKKKVFLNGKLIHEESTLFGSFNYTWRLSGRECLMIPNRQENGFDLFIEGVSFYDLLPSNARVVTSRDGGRRTERSSRPASSKEREEVDLQKAIELSLRESQKKVKEDVRQSTRTYRDLDGGGMVGWSAPEEEFPKKTPPKVPPPPRKVTAPPVAVPVIEDLISFEDDRPPLPVVPVVELPADLFAGGEGVGASGEERGDLSDTQAKESPQLPSRPGLPGIKTFNMAAGSPMQMDSRRISEDPIMDWFQQAAEKSEQGGDGDGQAEHGLQRGDQVPRP